MGAGTGVARRGASHSSYRHEAVLCRGIEGFLATTVPFVLEALELGQPVLVAVNERRREALRAALGRRGDAVAFVEMEHAGANPARIIPIWCDFVSEHASQGRPVRGVGEPVWSQRSSTEVLECELHEALLNVAVAPDTPLWLRCPYDVDDLPADVVERAHLSHPVVVEGEELRGSRAYGGVDHLERLFGAAFPVAAQMTVRGFGRDDLRTVREQVATEAAYRGLGADRSADLALAAFEAAANSVQHGGGRGELRIWREPAAVVCEVADTGLIDDPLVGRRTPHALAESGRGLWLANQLCDLVQLRSGRWGTAVRLHAYL